MEFLWTFNRKYKEKGSLNHHTVKKYSDRNKNTENYINYDDIQKNIRKRKEDKQYRSSILFFVLIKV